MPIELRLKVWNFALEHPRVFTIHGESHSNVTPASALQQACRESRILADQVLVRMAPIISVDGPWNINPILTNPAGTDTVWITFPPDEYFSGQEINRSLRRFPKYIHPVCNMAIWWEHAIKAMSTHFESFMAAISDNGTEEVILVVAGEHFQGARDIVFVKPRSKPYEILKVNNLRISSAHPFRNVGLPLKKLTWEYLEDDAMDTMYAYQSSREDERQEAAACKISTSLLIQMLRIAS